MVAQIGLTDTHTTISHWTQSCRSYTLLFHDTHTHTDTPNYIDGNNYFDLFFSVASQSSSYNEPGEGFNFEKRTIEYYTPLKVRFIFRLKIICA